MKVDIHNPTKATRVIHDGIAGSNREISIAAGAIANNIEIAQTEYDRLAAIKGDLLVAPAGTMKFDSERVALNQSDSGRVAVNRSGKPHAFVAGMWGVGDCIHGRAVIRQIRERFDVTLDTYYVAMHHDFIADGMKVFLRRQPPPRIAETTPAPDQAKPNTSRVIKVSYNAGSTIREGSQLAAQFATAGEKMPQYPDFSLPVRLGWRDDARALLATLNKAGKPVMAYRPIALNNVWRCENRSPDPDAYAALMAEIRNEYFVVSIADLTRKEWIVNPTGGQMMKADAEFHKGELPFEVLAGVFAEADLAFTNPGFSPIMAQAVGTPTVIVYGGNETYATTNAIGAHLAPTLAIEPVHPCGCHQGPGANHKCDKTIDLPKAVAALRAFVSRNGARTCAA